MNKKLLILLIISLAAAALAVVYFGLVSNAPTTNTQDEVKPFAVDKKDLSAASLPPGFQKDFPVETGSEILQNYQAQTTDGRTQSTRIVSTKRAIPETVSIYKNYFANLGWVQVGSTASSSVVQMIKNDDVLQIVGEAQEGVTQKTVQITLTQAGQ